MAKRTTTKRKLTPLGRLIVKSLKLVCVGIATTALLLTLMLAGLYYNACNMEERYEWMTNNPTVAIY